MKQALATIFQSLFTDVKDPRTLLMRTLTMFVALLSYIVVENQSEILNFAKSFSRDTVIEQVQGQRVANYPKVAKEHATMLYTQSNADEVVVAEYRPKFVNNYQDLIAWEGKLGVDPNKVINSVLEKGSVMYSYHIQAKNFEYIFEENPDWTSHEFVTSGSEFRNMGAEYIYTCPIFNMDNAYSGYVGLVYSEIPYTSEKEHLMLKEYLARVCEPHARALGRKK